MDNILNLFQSFRTILCVCPHCYDILRLADLRLVYKGKTPRTWLDGHDTKLRSLERKEELFEAKEEELREAATERGRRKVPKIVRRSMNVEFAKLPFNPYDIKAVLHPVDFVVFNGLNENEKLKNIVFLSKENDSPELKMIRKSVESTIDKGDYSWKLARVDINGKISFDEN